MTALADGRRCVIVWSESRSVRAMPRNTAWNQPIEARFCKRVVPAGDNLA